MEQVRATRAYIAGFGTAGSLLAGTAFVFVLASAVVSFRGWPQVGSQPASTAVVVSQPKPSNQSTAARRVAAVAAAQAAALSGSGVIASTSGPGAGATTGTNGGIPPSIVTQSLTQPVSRVAGPSGGAPTS